MRDLDSSAASKWIVACVFSFLVIHGLDLNAEVPRLVSVGVVGFYTETDALRAQHSLSEALRVRTTSLHITYQVSVVRAIYEEAAMIAAVERLRALHPDMVLVNSANLVQYVLLRIPEVPIVSAGEAFIELLPEVQSIARPGGRVTGFFRQVNQLSKRVETLKHACPTLRRVGFVIEPDSAADSVFLKFLVRESELLLKSGIVVVPLYLDIDQISDLPGLIHRHRLDALAISYSSAVEEHFSEVRQVIERLRIPHIYNLISAVSNGGAMAAQPAAFDFVKTGAEYIDRIAQGESPANIPIRISRAYDIMINTRLIQDFDGCDPRRLARIATRFYP